MATSDDTVTWAEETAPAYSESARSCWKIMIIDDDASVHSVTKLALRNFMFEGRRLQFISGYSGGEARLLMREHPDTAILLLDVVMEEEDAGLKAVRYIREELNNPFVRIILRTGQAGQAPEEKVIVDYDINDYKEKTELTALRLFTTIVAALRAYRDIMIIDANRRGLEKIIDASASIFKIQSMSKLVSGVLTQLLALLDLDKNSLYCQASGFAAEKSAGSFRILAATGNFEQYLNQNIAEVLPATVYDKLEQVFSAKQSMYFGRNYIGYHHSTASSENIIYLNGLRLLDEVEKDLVTVFFNNVSTAFDNIYLNQELSNDQLELLFTLGEIAETRSHETGIHIKRVAKYSKLLAVKYGLGEEEAECLKMASSMHDIGKLAIEDMVLNKPGLLTREEYEKIKLHSLAGHNILKASSRPLLQTAAIIALQHHEKYDGTGYPSGLAGGHIHIYGRITALADVLDALTSDRIYRKAWKTDRVLTYIKEERGRHFDPKLVDIFFDNLDEFLKILKEEHK